MWHKREEHWRMPRSLSKAYKCDPMRSMMTYFLRSPSTVAFPLRLTSSAVRFNRVYSKVTLGSLSVIYFPFLLFPECMNWTIRLVEHSGHTDIVHTSLYQQPLLPCWRFPSKTEMSVFDYLAVNRLLISSLPCHQQDILFCSLLYHLQRRHGWGMGTRAHTYAHVWTKQGLNFEAWGDTRHEPALMSEQKEGIRRWKEEDSVK